MSRRSNIAAPKTHRLVRGIHVIPQEIERAALFDLATTHYAPTKALERVKHAIEHDQELGPNTQLRRRLVRRLAIVESYVNAAANYATGGFQVATDVPVVRITWDEGASRFWSMKEHLEQAEHARQMAISKVTS